MRTPPSGRVSFPFNRHERTPLRRDEDQEALKELCVGFVEREIAPRVGELEASPRTVMPSLLRTCAKADLLSPEVPTTLGGGGLGLTASLHVSESLARDASFSVAHAVHSGLATSVLLHLASDAQRREWLGNFASGEWIAAFAATEPDAGSDTSALSTIARADHEGSGFRLSGEKCWITNAGFADVFVVLARIDAARYAFFLVPRDSAGVTVGPDERKTGLRGSSTCSLHFDDVRIPREFMLSDPDEGLRSFHRVIALGRLRASAVAVGLSRRALHAAASYASERRQFDSSIFSFALIREKLARMAARTWLAEGIVFASAHGIESRSSPGGKTLDGFAFEASVSKVASSEALGFVADEAVQIFGAEGFHEENPAERLSRDARVFRIFEGTNEINRLVAADELRDRWLCGDRGPDRIPSSNGAPDSLDRLIPFAGDALARCMAQRTAARDADQRFQAAIADLAATLFQLEVASARSTDEDRDLVVVASACAAGALAITLERLRSWVPSLPEVTRLAPTGIAQAEDRLAERVLADASAG